MKLMLRCSMACFLLATPVGAQGLRGGQGALADSAVRSVVAVTADSGGVGPALPSPVPAPVADEPVGLGAPPSGAYNAHKISPGGQLMHLGTLEIKGQTYRGIAGGEFASFSVGADGNITWSGGLSGMPDGWTLVRSVYIKDEQGRPLVRVYYRSKSGFNDAFDCVMEK